MCGLYELYKVRGEKDEITPSDLDAFFSTDNIKVKTAGLSGGEPMVGKHLMKITDLLIERLNPEIFYVITNGSKHKTLEKFIRRVLSHDNVLTHFVGVSVDGMGSVHDEMRGVKGAFNNALDALDLINEIRVEDERVVPTVTFTLMPFNYKELLKVFYLALSKRAGFNFRFVKPYELYDFSPDMMMSIQTHVNQMIKMMSRHKECRPEHSMVIDYNLKYLEGTIPHFKTKKRPYPCSVPELNLNIDPYGDIYPCHDASWLTGTYGNDEYKLGTVFDNTLNEILISPKRKQVFKKLEGCQRCWDECSYHTAKREYLEGLKIFRP